MAVDLKELEIIAGLIAHHIGDHSYTHEIMSELWLMAADGYPVAFTPSVINCVMLRIGLLVSDAGLDNPLGCTANLLAI